MAEYQFSACGVSSTVYSTYVCTRMKSIAQMVDDANTESEEDRSFNSRIEKLIELPLKLTTRNVGKRFRPILVKIFNYWLEVPEESMRHVEEAVQLIHNVSLLIDDIQDSSPLRRGCPAAHTIFGVAKTLITVDYKIYSSLRMEQLKIYPYHILRAFVGQATEMHHRDNGSCPSEEEYIKMIIGKTGRAFLASFEDLNRCSEYKKDFTKAAVYLAVAFQITDDLNNLTDAKYFETKGYCEDLTEGKFGFPVIHAIRTRPEGKEVLDIVRKRPKDNETKRKCVQLLEQCGSFEYTKRKIHEFKSLLCKELNKLGPNPYLPELYPIIGTLY